MTVKDFIAHVGMTNNMIEIKFKHKILCENSNYITKCSEYDDITPYMMCKIHKIRSYKGISTINSIINLFTGSKKKFNKTWQIYIN